MPIYEYECDSCGNRFEREQDIFAEALEECNRCGVKSLRRLISRPVYVKVRGKGTFFNNPMFEPVRDEERMDWE